MKSVPNFVRILFISFIHFCTWTLGYDSNFRGAKKTHQRKHVVEGTQHHIIPERLVHCLYLSKFSSMINHIILAGLVIGEVDTDLKIYMDFGEGHQ